MHTKKRSNQRLYICPFCKRSIITGSKTEIFYRNKWIDGCNTCFDLSINKPTTASFQAKDFSFPSAS